jgi:hypothetical protein
MFDQTRNLEDFSMVSLHIRETKRTAVILGLLHHTQKYGKSYGVDKLHIGKVDHQFFQPVVEILFTFLLETYGPDVVDVSSGRHDGYVLS